MPTKNLFSSLFNYENEPRQRKHGPIGYSAYSRFRPWLRDEFDFRCAYCLNREQWGVLKGSFDLDHFIPREIDPSLELVYDNLVYACHRCNLTKSSGIIPDPHKHAFGECLQFNDDGMLSALNKEGELLLDLMDLNDPDLVKFRALIVEIVALAEQASRDLILSRMFEVPADSPNLKNLRPPGGNTRPKGLQRCWYLRRGEMMYVASSQR